MVFLLSSHRRRRHYRVERWHPPGHPIRARDAQDVDTSALCVRSSKAEGELFSCIKYLLLLIFVYVSDLVVSG